MSYFQESRRLLSSEGPHCNRKMIRDCLLISLFNFIFVLSFQDEDGMGTSEIVFQIRWLLCKKTKDMFISRFASKKVGYLCAQIVSTFKNIYT